MTGKARNCPKLSANQKPIYRDDCNFFFIAFTINRHIFLSTSNENLCITYHVKSTYVHSSVQTLYKLVQSLNLFYLILIEMQKVACSLRTWLKTTKNKLNTSCYKYNISQTATMHISSICPWHDQKKRKWFHIVKYWKYLLSIIIITIIQKRCLHIFQC